MQDARGKTRARETWRNRHGTARHKVGTAWNWHGTELAQGWHIMELARDESEIVQDNQGRGRHGTAVARHGTAQSWHGTAWHGTGTARPGTELARHRAAMARAGTARHVAAWHGTPGMARELPGYGAYLPYGEGWGHES